MPYELQKVAAMDAASYAPGFAVQLALKDIDLAAAAAAPSPLLRPSAIAWRRPWQLGTTMTTWPPSTT
jgi:3-hydroxyisobutyrate dehydrogenase-like beta-hydroxyacid dehydrogenase